MKTLQQLAIELFDYAYPLKQTDRGAYDTLTEIASGVMQAHVTLEGIIKEDEA